MKLAFRKIILTLVLGLVFLTSGQSFASQINNVTNLQLTHTLYTAFFNTYFNEGDEKYRIQYFAHKQYLLTFLETWDKMIQTEKYSSSEEIFLVIKNTPGYLGKYFYIWENIYKGNPINLGYTKNGALKAILNSEKEKDIEKRIISVLTTVKVDVLANSHDYILATALSTPFRNVENKEIRESARSIVDQIPFQRGVEVLSLLKDFVAPGAGVIGAVSKSQKLVRVYKTTSKLRLALLTQSSRLTTSLASKTNPFLKKVSRIQITMAGSVAVHAGIIFAGTDPKNNKNLPINNFDSIDFGLASLWESTSAMSESKDNVIYNFKPHFKPTTKEQLAAKILSALDKKTPINYSEVFIAAEKLLKIDKRPITDNLATDISLAKMNLFSAQLSRMYSGNISHDQFNEIRKNTIENFLENYKRDYPNMTSVLLGWGGNCVSQTMIFTALLNNKTFENGYKPGIVLFTDHIEAVIYNNEKVLFTVASKSVARKGAIIYKPEILLFLTLKNLGIDSKYTENDFIVDGKKESKASNQGSSKVAFENPISKLMQTLKREGLFEGRVIQNLTVAWADNSTYSTEDTPETSKIEFQPNDQSFLEKPGSGLPFRFDRKNQTASTSGSTQPPVKVVYKPQPDRNEKISLNYEGEEVWAVEAFDLNAFKEIHRALKTTPRRDHVDQIRLLQIKHLQDIFNNKEFQYAMDNLDLMGKSEVSLPDQEIKRISYYRNLISRLLPLGNYCEKTVMQVNGKDYYGISICENLSRKYPNFNAVAFDYARDYFFNIDQNPLRSFFEYPEVFIARYNDASPAMKKLLFDIVQDPILTDRDYKVYHDSASVAILIKNYLNSLPIEIVKIVPPELKKNCPKHNIQLPRATKGSTGLFVFEENSKDCSEDLLKNKDTVRKEVPQEKSKITLNAESIITLSLAFGGGYQLWNEDVINTFHNGQYETVFGREAEIHALKKVLEKRQLREHPALTEYRKVLSTSTPAR